MRTRTLSAMALPLAMAMAAWFVVACEAGGSGRGGAAEARRARPELHQLWRWQAPPPAYVGMPAADADGVSFTSGLSRLVLLDGAGRTRWVAEKPHLRDVAPRLTPNVVIAPTEAGLAAFDRSTGRATWTAAFGERANTPSVAGDVVVASTWDGSVVGVDLATGALRWRTPLPGASLGPTAADERTAVTTWVADDHSAAGAVAVDPATGRQRWAVSLPVGGVSAPAISGSGAVVVVAGDVAAHGLDLETGAERWRAELDGAGSPEVPPLVVPGGDVLVAHRLGGMALLDPDGRRRWQVGSDGAAVRGGPTGPSPEGRFALPLDDGRLLIAGPGAPTATLDPPGRVSGVATGPGAALLAGSREAADNGVTASSGW